MEVAADDVKLARATLALLRQECKGPTQWLPDRVPITDDTFVARLASIAKPVLCIASVQTGMLTFACWTKRDDAGGSPLAGLAETHMHVEFGRPDAAVILSPAEFETWLEHYDFVQNIGFAEVRRDEGVRLRAELLNDDGPASKLSTVTEWPLH